MVGDASRFRYTLLGYPSVSVPLAACSLSTTLRAVSHWGLFNNTGPCPVPIPVPIFRPLLHRFHLPLPFVSRRAIPLPILCSRPLPGPFLTTLRVILTLAFIIVIAIASMAHSTAWCSRIRQGLIIIIFLNDLIPIQWSNGQEVAWFVLPAAWQLNLCPEIIATVPREPVAYPFIHPPAGSLRFKTIDLIPKGMGVVPLPIFHLVAGFIKCLPHISADSSPPLPKR